MGEQSEVRTALLAVLRRWPMVVAFVAVGAIAMAGVSMRGGKATSYSAISRINVGVATVSNMPTPAGTAVYASSARARAAVEASEGLDPAGVLVTAAADQKDPQTVNITVSAPSAETAEAWATAVAEQCRAYGLARYGWMIDMEESKAARLVERIAYLDKQVAEFRRLAAAASDTTSREQYLVAAQTFETMTMAYEDQLDISKFTRQGYLSWITAFPASTATKVSVGGATVSNVSRGALAGLFLGAVIAVILENRRRRRPSSD